MSECSKLEPGEIIGQGSQIQTDGYSLSAVRLNSQHYPNCRNEIRTTEKQMNFYLPLQRSIRKGFNKKPFRHGQILVNIFGGISEQPPIKIYSLEDSGKKNMIINLNSALISELRKGKCGTNLTFVQAPLKSLQFFF